MHEPLYEHLMLDREDLRIECVCDMHSCAWYGDLMERAPELKVYLVNDYTLEGNDAGVAQGVEQSAHLIDNYTTL